MGRVRLRRIPRVSNRPAGRQRGRPHRGRPRPQQQGGPLVEHALQAEEETPLPHRTGARVEGEERQTAQTGSRRPQRVAQDSQREPLPQQEGEGGARR